MDAVFVAVGVASVVNVHDVVGLVSAVLQTFL